MAIISKRSLMLQVMVNGLPRRFLSRSRGFASSAFVTPRRRYDCFLIRGPSLASASRNMRTSSTTSSYPGKGFGKQNQDYVNDEWEPIHVPLVFVPGMKGTHLAFKDGDVEKSSTSKKKRVWLTLSHLLNIPPRPDGDPMRDLSLPLTYDEPSETADSNVGNDDCLRIATQYPKQHRGNLVPDGVVDHIIEFNFGSAYKTGEDPRNFVDLNFLPFYGHITRLLREMDRRYHKRLHDGKTESTDSFRAQDDVLFLDREISSRTYKRDDIKVGTKGIFDIVGSFIERTSNWAFVNASNSTADEQQSHHPSKYCRPTAVFSYDWRRSLPELCADLHEFCETSFPNQPVQILAHSLGGLMTFAAMRSHPEKYSPGAVVVGVPFETGIQYLQDLHKGYYTELDRCRQFLPEAQFTMSSHWSFFPISKKRLEDRFVDVTNCTSANTEQKLKFEADVSGIGKTGATFQPKVEGANAYFDFYNPDEWEQMQLGVFGPEYDDKLTDDERQAYRNHMRTQMAAAKDWRRQVLGEDENVDNESELVNDTSGNALSRNINFPPFVACASDKIPTVNQILRRKKQQSSTKNTNARTRKGRSTRNAWEYDYINGRSVPGDGRIDFDKAFPPSFIACKKVTLDSTHAKQMCWEESGGSLSVVYKEVVEQVSEYLKRGPNRILDTERTLSIEQFETATRPDVAQEEMREKYGSRHTRLKSFVAKVRNVRARIMPKITRKKSRHRRDRATMSVPKPESVFPRRR
eukprot:CCRYP_006317-RA/>CCRYP_006317-RA protein AED:0.24 eAED:0.24 QI:574/1/1/1/1/1/2/440/746